jgi:hypothetical protein
MAALVFLVLAAWPPWVARLSAVSDHPGRQIVLYHAPIWNRPAVFNDSRIGSLWRVEIDTLRMVLEMMSAEVLVAALFLTWGKRR